MTGARWLEQSRAGLSGRELRPLGRDQCAGPELPLCGGSCGGSLPAQKELGASFRPPSVLGLILGGGTCLRPGAGSGRRVCGFRATQAGALGFVSRLQDPENHVSVLGGKLGQTPGPARMVSNTGTFRSHPNPIGSRDPRGFTSTFPAPESSRPACGWLGPRDWLASVQQGFPGPRPEPRSWPFRLACPSPALRSSDRESCEASVEIRTTDCQASSSAEQWRAGLLLGRAGPAGRGARVCAVLLRQSRTARVAVGSRCLRFRSAAA